MKIKRVDFKRYCRDKGIDVIYNIVNDEYIVKLLGIELTRKKSYIECEDYIYEVILNEFFSDN